LWYPSQSIKSNPQARKTMLPKPLRPRSLAANKRPRQAGREAAELQDEKRRAKKERLNELKKEDL
jgi:hypothetical protein